MSSTEIEDVLSSIRRLVSDDLRPVARSTAAPASEAGKLILTPALRVVQAAPAAAKPAPAKPDGQSPAAVQEATQASPLPIFIATRRVHIDGLAEAPFVEAEPAPIERVVASLGAAVTAQPDDWEPEHGDAPIEVSLIGEAWARSEMPFAVEPGVVAEVDEGEVAEAGEAVPGWAQDDDSETETTQTEDSQEIISGTIEPDSDWADAAEASVIASLQVEDDDAQARQTDEAEAEADPDFRFNEDVLRELVRDILREELAGRMGERITRNIRKLVRAEIATIMAAQELE